MTKLIAIEGIDRSGKSSAIKYLNESPIAVETTAEPTASQIGRLAKEKTNTKQQALLMMADRLDHNTTLNYLLRDNHVVCDRYVDSTKAYQGPFLNNKDWFYSLVEDTSLNVDHTIYIDITVDMAKRRGAKEFVDDLQFARNEYHDLYDISSTPLQYRVKDNVTVINGMQKKTDVMSQIDDRVEELIN